MKKGTPNHNLSGVSMAANGKETPWKKVDINTNPSGQKYAKTAKNPIAEVNLKGSVNSNPAGQNKAK